METLEELNRQIDALDAQLDDSRKRLEELLEEASGVHLKRIRMLLHLTRAKTLAEEISEDTGDKGTELSHAILAGRLHDILSPDTALE